jgi:hypothetical protein
MSLNPVCPCLYTEGDLDTETQGGRWVKEKAEIGDVLETPRSWDGCMEQILSHSSGRNQLLTP